MVENNFLPLDLNESIFFETGYEIGEMVSISLDPEISIQKFSDYVSIRGVISLEGEYVKSSEVLKHQDPQKDKRVEHIYRSVAKIAKETDERVNFYHHFPIEISVPFERISKMDDVTVSVEAFDYLLPDTSEMQVAATLHINGITKSEKQRRTRKTRQSRVEQDDTLQFEVIDKRPQEETVKQGEHKQELSMVERTSEQDELLTPRAKSPVVQESHTAKTEQIVEEKQTTEATQAKQESLPVDERLEQDISQATGQQTVENQPKEQSEQERPTEDGKETVAELVNEEDEKLAVETKRDESESIQITEQIDIDESTEEDLKDVLYLAEIFDHEDEEETYQMRLCIVQDDETIADIAKRYEITQQKIAETNDLTDETILPGQLLLIPHIKQD